MTNGGASHHEFLLQRAVFGWPSCLSFPMVAQLMHVVRWLSQKHVLDQLSGTFVGVHCSARPFYYLSIHLHPNSKLTRSFTGPKGPCQPASQQRQVIRWLFISIIAPRNRIHQFVDQTLLYFMSFPDIHILGPFHQMGRSNRTTRNHDHRIQNSEPPKRLVSR